MLERAKKELPEVQENQERFEVPNVKGYVEGSKTVITNFLQIAQAFRRDPKHLSKYVLQELATPGDLKKQFLVFGRKIPSKLINEKIEKYFNEYVVCKECGKPDTKLVIESDYAFIRCQACGARNAVRSKI